MPDLHAGALGSGATRPYESHLALSTTSWISCPVGAKKTDALHSIATAPGLTNDSYLVVNNQETGAKALEWFRGVLAASGPTLSYDDLTALAATSPPGANGVVFAPWLAGERSPVEDKRVRATFSSLSVTTTTADMARAVLEGVAANSAWLLGHVERFTGRRSEPIRLVGGGAESRSVVPDLRRHPGPRGRAGPEPDVRPAARRGADDRGRPRRPFPGRRGHPRAARRALRPDARSAEVAAARREDLKACSAASASGPGASSSA